MNIGTLHVHTNDFLLYLTIAYTLFFVVVMAYVMSLSRRQARVQSELTLVRQAIDEQRRER